MNEFRRTLAIFLVSVPFLVGCSRRHEPSAAPPTVLAPIATLPADAATPAATPDVMTALRSCQRDCSIEANQKQANGYVACDRTSKKSLGRCRTQVLTATDAERAACRHQCEETHGKTAEAP